MKSLRQTVVLGIALLASGCGGASEFPRAHIQGTVTIDGQPVEEGVINFVPLASGQGPSTTAEVIGGSYRADVPLGKVRVEFQATRETGRMVDEYGTMQPERVNVIPPKYRSGMEIEVNRDDTRRSFALTSP